MNASIHNRKWLAVIASLVCALPLAATAARQGSGGAKVTVTAAVPSEAFQGEELSVVVSGSGFDAGTTVSYLVTGTTDASQVDVLQVQYISSSELRTYIRPKANALTTDYDIEARTSTGRKGKGTTLFRVKQGGGPPPAPTLPTEPDARMWHAFTDNGGTTHDTSRLYLFGGTGGYENGWQLVPPYLWYFSVAEARWVLAPTGTATPTARAHVGLSCGDGLCVVANGVNCCALKETWVYSEAGGAWSQVNCGKRYVCPSARYMPAMAYDSARYYHVLFGGDAGSQMLGDTYTFLGSTQRWTLQKPSASPSPRSWAAAAYAAGPVNRVVLFGGWGEPQEILCDMWSWTGTEWEEIEQIIGPCLMGHNMVWDGARLLVTGGFYDWKETLNDEVWTFEFTPDGTAGTWSYESDWYSRFECIGADAWHNYTRMAYDRPSGLAVFFGGGENIVGLGAAAYDDLSVCQ